MSSPDDPIPWLAWPILIRPRRVVAHLRLAQDSGLVERAPNAWQICMGVMRMWHRNLFRADTVGTCKDFQPRDTRRARLLQRKSLRFFGLMWERAITPLDLSGLLSPPERITRHLLAAHHDGVQFHYDLELLSLHPGRLEALQEQVEAVLAEVDPARTAWLRDLVVFETYHERLAAAIRRFQAGASLSPEQADNPDVTLSAYLRWCAQQPATPLESWRAWRRGALRFESTSV
ncbi:MAG: hypothetical protein H6739_17850 [Alphaproteobacteria bacterium]|nr:hypothetical protein [Alphaproteobacteria bacterium]